MDFGIVTSNFSIFLLESISVVSSLEVRKNLQSNVVSISHSTKEDGITSKLLSNDLILTLPKRR